MPKEYKMVIIPYHYVPHRVAFRFQNNWWIKKSGEVDLARKFEDSKVTRKFKQTDLIAMVKKLIENPLANLEIHDEFIIKM